MNSLTSFSEQTQTAWTMIQSAQADDVQLKNKCIDYLLETYTSAIKAIIYKAGVHNQDQLDDLTQEFCRHFIEKDIISKLDREKGRFRGFLSISVRNFIRDHFRKTNKDPREVSIHAQNEEQNDLELESDDTPLLESYNKAWAKTIMKNALSRFYEHCEKKELEHYKVVFERHVLDPQYHEFPKQKDTAALLDKSVKDVENICRRSQALFRDKVKAVIRETVEHERDVDEELKELKRCFGGVS